MPKTKKPDASGLTLPEHMKPSPDEAALCARLIRVRRHKRYWLRYFIERLLHMDAASGEDLTVSQAEDALKVMKSFRELADVFRRHTAHMVRVG